MGATVAYLSPQVGTHACSLHSRLVDLYCRRCRTQTKTPACQAWLSGKFRWLVKQSVRHGCNLYHPRESAKTSATDMLLSMNLAMRYSTLDSMVVTICAASANLAPSRFYSTRTGLFSSLVPQDGMVAGTVKPLPVCRQAHNVLLLYTASSGILGRL